MTLNTFPLSDTSGPFVRVLCILHMFSVGGVELKLFLGNHGLFDGLPLKVMVESESFTTLQEMAQASTLAWIRNKAVAFGDGSNGGT